MFIWWILFTVGQKKRWGCYDGVHGFKPMMGKKKQESRDLWEVIFRVRVLEVTCALDTGIERRSVMIQWPIRQDSRKHGIWKVCWPLGEADDAGEAAPGDGGRRTHFSLMEIYCATGHWSGIHLSDDADCIVQTHIEETLLHMQLYIQPLLPAWWYTDSSALSAVNLLTLLWITTASFLARIQKSFTQDF